MSAPLAYFLSWRTYGTWLPGDNRGWVDDYHNFPNTTYQAPDEDREYQAELAMRSPLFVLSDDARAVAEAVIRKHCEIRKWRLIAVNVRTNHIHLVVDCRESASPETALEQFKAWITRRLREAGLVGTDQRIWVEHGSTRWINKPDDLDKAVNYTINMQ